MRYLSVLALGVFGVALQVGCRDNSPAPPRMMAPELGRDTFRREADYPKPLPPADPTMTSTGPQPFYDEPLLVDNPPEAKAFLDVYRKVGRPHLAVFVNRAPDGAVLPSRDPGPERIVEHTREATTGVSVDRGDGSLSADYRGVQARDNHDRFKMDAGGKYTETTTEFRKPGEYDDVKAKAIDYMMMEALLADWMGVDGQVTIISPMMVHKKLSEEQIKDLQSGRPHAMSEIAQTLDADVLIQVQARPSRQTGQGTEIRVLAEAVDLRRGDSLARAAVDFQPPLDKRQVNTYMRFVARKMMDGMVQTWTTPRGTAERVTDAAPAPAPAPRNEATPGKAPAPAPAPQKTAPEKPAAKPFPALPPLPAPPGGLPPDATSATRP